jgi:hypothetical protein
VNSVNYEPLYFPVFSSLPSIPPSRGSNILLSTLFYISSIYFFPYGSGLCREHYFHLRSSIFWDITPCIQLKMNWRFGRIYCLHIQGWRVGDCLLHASFLLELLFSSEDGDSILLGNIGLNFNGLHGVVSTKTELVIITVSRTQNHTFFF